MSKRVPMIVIGIVIVLLLAAPFGLGMLAESNVREEIERLNDYPGFTFEVTGYERGWLGSRATIEAAPELGLFQTLAAADPEIADAVNQMKAPFVLELGHGPVLTLNGFGIGSYAVKAGLDPETEWVRTATTTLGIPYLIELRGRAGFGTGFDFEGDIPPFEGADEDETYSFSGLPFSGHTDGTDLTFDASLERAAVQGAAESVSIEGVGVTGDYELRPGTMALGSGEISVASLIVTNPLLGADAATGFTGFRISSGSGLNDAGNLDFSVVYAIDSISVPALAEITDSALGIELTNLDAQAVDELYALFDRVYSGALDPSLLALEMLPIFDRVVAAGPALSLDPVQFSMDGEQLRTTLSVSIDATALPTGQAMDLMDPAVAMAAVTAELELTASKALLSQLVALGLEQQMAAQLAGMSEDQIDAVLGQQADQSIAMIVAQGMLRDDGDNYSTTITFADGVATVNGNPLPLEAMGLF